MRRCARARRARRRRSSASRTRSSAARVIERAKGILMERHGIDEREAFERAARRTPAARNRTVVDVAAAVAEGHALLPKGQD